MSKVVIFNGSPRKNGYTAKLLEQVAKGAKSKGAEVIEFDLNDSGIRGCQGCFYCRTHDGCAIKDYLQPMYKAITEADAIVFGSPIYYYQITGQAKVWLDRTWPMLGDMIDHSFIPRHPGKKLITVFAQANPDPKIHAEGIDFINNVFALYGWNLEDSIRCCGTSASNFAISEELSLRAFKDGENLIG